MKKACTKSEMLINLEQLEDFYIEDMTIISSVMSYLHSLTRIAMENEPSRDIVKFIFNKDKDMYDVIFNNMIYIGANDIALQTLIKSPWAIYINEHLSIKFLGYWISITRDGETFDCDIFNYTERLSPEELKILNEALNTHYKYYNVNSMTYIEIINCVY